MREIKFRAKIKAVVSNWVYGSLITYKDGSADICGVDIFRKGDKRSMLTGVKPDTVGQFTGLHDKNGTEIYEGDIVRVDISRSDHRIKNRQYMNDKVEWYQYKFILSKADINVNMTYRIEVIGNIHDNPELLEGGVK